MLEKQKKRQKRHKRLRAKIYGTAVRPRLYVFRSNKHIYAQLIDDESKKALVVASDLELKKKERLSNVAKPQDKKTKQSEKKEKNKNIAVAYEVGKLLAQKSLIKKIKKSVLDRGGYKYHGRVKALAEGAREGGLNF